MKKEFGTVKNIILLIASALALVAVTFAWFNLSKKNYLRTIDTDIGGSTLAVSYYESNDGGANYSVLPGDLNFDNMTESSKRYYRMDVHTYNVPIKLIMSFDGLGSSNTFAKYVYFDYKIVCNGTGDVLGQQTGLRLSNYTSANVFSQDLASLQGSGNDSYSVYYDVYLVSGGAALSGTGSLGEVKLVGQQTDA